MTLYISKSEFLNGTSDYAKQMREKYGNDTQAYENYKNATSSSLFFSYNEKVEEKEEAYKQAKAKLQEQKNKWNQFKYKYSANLAQATAKNGGFSLNGTQRHQVLQATGDGALKSFKDLEKAQSDLDFALSEYQDAAFSGISYLT